MNPVGVPPYSYTWSPNVGTTATVSNLSAVTYNVTVTDANQCTKTNSIVLVCASRIEETNGNALTTNYDINIYPNPADGLVTIAFNSDKENVYSMKLFDMTGRVIKSEVDNSIIGENTHIMNLEGIAKGIYIIELQMGEINKKGKRW